eukprot:TRINITY_DN1466_c0_g2_i3.p1 TRINITY_DN1466_c0_g2~~TRINITY_DN1466_c0_g2_i3.p1  ORF type:complete len:134 (+),score=32.11 TRINITY_DN1466_c0_g2_i3:213-614(+)
MPSSILCKNASSLMRLIISVMNNDSEVSKYTRCLAKIEPKPDTEFSLYEGRIVGRILTLEDEKRIVQEWKMNDWSVSSTVEITFKVYDEDGCKVEIKQTGFPSNVDSRKLEDGWMSQIIKPMSTICGYPLEDD